MNYMQQAGVLELTGNFGAAMRCLDAAQAQAMANDLLRKHYQQSLARLCGRIDGAGVMRNLAVTQLYQGAESPDSYDFETEAGSNAPARPIVSLTTIAARMPRLERTIDSMLAQQLPAHSINLFISREPFLVDEGIAPDDARLGALARKGVNIYHCANIGPYRKQYPLLSILHAAGAHPQTPIVTIDDDVLYPSDTLQRLVAGLYESDCVTSFRGRVLATDEHGIASYKQCGEPGVAISLSNIGTGKNGIAYKLGFFPQSTSHYVGPLLAPTADDIWCKWVTATVCIPTCILVPQAAFDPSLDFAETDPEDKLGLFHKYNARGSNDDAIRSLELWFTNKSTGLHALIRDVKR